MTVVLMTGAATGIVNLTAHALAAAGHTVYAAMQNVAGRNAARAEQFRAEAREQGTDPRVVELDVTSQDSAMAAVTAILAEAGQRVRRDFINRMGFGKLLTVNLHAAHV